MRLTEGFSRIEAWLRAIKSPRASRTDEQVKGLQMRTALMWATMGVVFFMAYRPGLMSPDSYDQFRQALLVGFNNSHPAVMAMVWSLLMPAFGTSSIFLLHTLAFFGSFAMLSYWFVEKYRRFPLGLLILSILPTSLVALMWVWKDVALAVSVLFLIAAYVWLKEGWSSRWLWAGILFFSYYAVNVRHGGVLYLFPLAGLFVQHYWSGLAKQWWLKKWILLGLSGFFLTGLFYFIQAYALNKMAQVVPNTETHNFYHDMVGTLARVYDNPNAIDEFPNEFIKDPSRKNELVSVYFSNPTYADNFTSRGSAKGIIVPSVGGRIVQPWIKVIANHPVAYLKHRISFAVALLWRVELTDSIKTRTWSSSNALSKQYKDMNIDQKSVDRLAQDVFISTLNVGNAMTAVVNWWNHHTAKLFFRPIVHVVLALCLAGYFVYRKEYNLPLALSFSSLAGFALLLLFLPLVGDVRYYYWNYIVSAVNVWLIYMRWRYGLRI